MRVLLLGGTGEARALAAALHPDVEVISSLAGRVPDPALPVGQVRIGGFGGVAGLTGWLREHRITAVVDATHPFAAQMSRNAVAACAATGTPLIALERRPWAAGSGDDWTHVADIETAAAALPETPERVFLAIGRQHLAAFAAKPQHHYLLRLVDPPEGALPLPDAEAVISRGPFGYDDDLELLRSRRTTRLVTKNAGGEGARAKLDAARTLGLPVIVVDRPALPPRASVETVAEVLAWLHAERGV